LVPFMGNPPPHLAAINTLETVGRGNKAPRTPYMRASTVLALKYAIRGGIGLGLIPDYLTAEETELVPILPELELPKLPIYFVYPEELKSAKKIQVFRDFMVTKGRQWKY
jgi:DNA-binding transcriptional LysR family regulator